MRHEKSIDAQKRGGVDKRGKRERKTFLQRGKLDGWMTRKDFIKDILCVRDGHNLLLLKPNNDNSLPPTMCALASYD